MKPEKTEGQRVKIMRISINWKSPPQKGHREPIPWGIPGLQCEKRIPKHGDERKVGEFLPFGKGDECEKRIPKHGDEG